MLARRGVNRPRVVSTDLQGVVVGDRVENGRDEGLEYHKRTKYHPARAQELGLHQKVNVVGEDHSPVGHPVLFQEKGFLL